VTGTKSILPVFDRQPDMKKENFGPKEIRTERKYFGPNINGKLKSQ
jgi:hypothetical protein